MSLKLRAFGLSFLIHLVLFLTFTLVFKLALSTKEKVLELDLSFFETYEIKKEYPEKNHLREQKPKPLHPHKLQEKAKGEEAKPSVIQENIVSKNVAYEKSVEENPPQSPLAEAPKKVESTSLPAFTNQQTPKGNEGKHISPTPTTESPSLQGTGAYKIDTPNPSRKEEGELYIKEKLAIISSIVQNNITYPPIARRMGWEGSVLLGIKLSEDGTVEEIHILQSSGYDILDKNAVETIKKVSHLFPKPPVKVFIKLPISYKLY